MHILGADLAAVGLAQGFQNLAEGRGSLAGGFTQGAGEEFAVEIPDRKPVSLRFELGVAIRLLTQRVEIGNQVAAHAIGVDQLDNAGFLGDLFHPRRGHARQQGLAVDLPMDRRMRHLQIGEERVVEPVLAIQQRLHFAQERARFRALNNAVIIGAGDAHHLADSENGARLFRRALVFGGIIDSAGGDDAALAQHQARIGGHGADRAGIGQRDGSALEIGWRQAAGAGARHQIVKCRHVFGKRQRRGVLNVRDHQAAGAVLARHIHGNAEIHLRAQDAIGLAVALGIRVVQRGQIAQGLHHRPADDVSVGDFALAGDGAVLIDDAAVLVHHLDGDGALRRGERNGNAGPHIFGNAAGGAAQGLKLLAGAGLDRRRGGR